MELSKEEKELLQLYSYDFSHAQEIALRLKASEINLKSMALFARGFSPLTHAIDEKGVIQIIKQPEPPKA